MSWVDTVEFDENGLAPVVVLEHGTGQVLMLAYANREALELTRSTGQAWYWSRERRKLWRKGETSGNTQQVVSVSLDCDRDAVLYTVVQTGDACHEGHHSCFHNPTEGPCTAEHGRPPGAAEEGRDLLERLTGVIEQRKRDMPEGSYVARLLAGGREAVARKVGEEASEFMVALLAEGRERAVSEAADLLFHSMVALAAAGASIEDVLAELGKREGAPQLSRSVSRHTEAT
ncbi:MAG: bifunctional phosphoribosyl-AMP cyclohydrolase/phosphoribosyl-ATP diphosphatase HisIE [Firmicutes bacterium]|nr:bifunctional phosphoribosyl-AMP cyclohydrolase/phosphoribosyl-ATP diphosphatase HisIE [Bacillota bacterium]